MNIIQLPIALFTFFALVAVVPAWMHFVDTFSDALTTEATFLAQLVLPAVVALFLASWVQSG